MKHLYNGKKIMSKTILEACPYCGEKFEYLEGIWRRGHQTQQPFSISSTGLVEKYLIQ